MNYLRHEDLPAKGITYSKAQIWRLRKKADDDPMRFPDPVKGLGPVDLWVESDVDEYVERRVAAARQKNKQAA